MKKLLLITNPKAGKNNGKKIAAHANDILKNNNFTTEIIFSEYSGHSQELANKCETDKYDGIIAIGGDGTLFEVINGLLKSNNGLTTPVGQIPVGTGNSFIKDLNINDPDTAIQKIIAGNTKKIDVGYFKSNAGEYYFINLLGAGFVSNVGKRSNKYKLLGPLSYILGVLEELVTLKPYQLELTIDDKVYKRENIFIELCNSTKTGGDMIMAPDAKINDGLLDVILLNKISRMKLLQTFPKIFKGTHLSIPQAESFKAKYIKVVTDKPQVLTPDGEILGTTPIEVTILPQKINIYC